MKLELVAISWIWPVKKSTWNMGIYIRLNIFMCIGLFPRRAAAVGIWFKAS
jgi:hypothetical protein